MRSIAESGSLQSWLITLLGLGMVTLIMLSVRLIVMQTLQRRRERENRQINERLRLLIGAYKTLGGSFTGDLAVDPAHLRSLRAQASQDNADAAESTVSGSPGSERRRRIRDAVEAALSDVILLGTADQVQLAVAAAQDLVSGEKVQMGALVVALRAYIRDALDLEPMPPLDIPKQGPTRTVPSGARGGAKGQARTAGGRAGGGGAGGSGGADAGIDGPASGRSTNPDS